MDISKEDQERIEKENPVDCVFPEEQLSWTKGATHEHLTQVLPLRQQLKKEEDECLDWFSKVEQLEIQLAEKDKEMQGYKNESQHLDATIQSLKEENERLRADNPNF